MFEPLVVLVLGFLFVVVLLFNPLGIKDNISDVIDRLRKLPAHDPMDWRTTSTSGKWYTDEYCLNCKGWSTHADRMSGICHHCGSKKGHRWRSARRIWNGRKWVAQFKYGDGPTEYEIE